MTKLKLITLCGRSSPLALGDQMKFIWRPIETAPKDGSQFLVTNGECVVMGTIVDANEELFVFDVTDHEAIGWGLKGRENISHWMPLPEPPKCAE
jgi:hypothetical protein